MFDIFFDIFSGSEVRYCPLQSGARYCNLELHIEGWRRGRKGRRRRNINYIKSDISPRVRWGLLNFMYAVLPFSSFFSSFFFFLPSLFSVDVARYQHRSLECSGQRRTWIASSRLQWAAPDLNRGALEWTGQRRTSPGELWSGLGNAGPHPGSSRAEWAAPGLSR